MKNLINKPHLIFLLAIPIIMLIGIFSRDSALETNVHDTYYVIAHVHLATLISIFFGIIGIGYWVMQNTKRKLSKWLNWIHIIMTIGGFITMFVISHLTFDSSLQSEFPLFDNLSKQSLILSLIFLIILFGQLFYLVNIIIGIFRENKNSC